MGIDNGPADADTTNQREIAGAVRWTASLVLVVLGAALWLVAVPAQYLHTVLLDSEHYVATVGPLATDPVIQAEVIDQVTDHISGAVDVEALAREALGELAGNTPRAGPTLTGLAPVIAEQTRTLMRSAVSRVVLSPRFEDFWIGANRLAHERLLSLARGGTGGVASMDEQGEVSISVRGIVAEVKDLLGRDGLGIAERIPDADVRITLFEWPGLARVGQAVTTLDQIHPLVAWMAASSAVGAIVVAPKTGRLRAVGAIGIGLAAVMGLLTLGLSMGRSLYLRTVGPEVLSPAAAEVLVEAFLLPLRTGVRTFFVVGLLIALLAWLLGRSGTSDPARRRISRVAALLTGRTGDGQVRRWRHVLARRRRTLAACIVGVALVLLVFLPDPTTEVALWTAALAASALIALMSLGSPATVHHPDDDPGDPASGVNGDSTHGQP